MAEPLITQYGSSFDVMAYYMINARKPFATCRETRVRFLLVAKAIRKARVGAAYSTSCFSGFFPSAPAQTMLRITSGSPTPNDHRMPKCSAM